MSFSPREAFTWAGRSAAILLGSAGVWLLTWDAIRSISGRTVSLKPLGQVWYDLHAPGLNTLQAAIQRYISPEFWDFVIAPVLNWPAFVLPLALAALLAALTWPRGR
jgi:hypothetical protein